jgi:glycosyltransferase 2 family protein
VAPTVETRSSAPTRLERVGQVAAHVGSLRPADPRVRRGVHAAIATVLIASAALALAAAVGDFPEVDWRFRPVALGLALIGFAVSLLAAAELWRRVLGSLGPTLEPRRSAAIWFVSGLGRYVPTSLLLPMLRAAMSEREGVPKRVCLASVAYEMSTFFTAALILGAYFVIDLPDLRDSPGRYLVVVLPVLALIALHPRIFHTLADRLLLRLGREPLPLSLPERRVVEFVGLYSVTYVIAGLSLYALAQCVYPVDESDLVTVVGAFAVGTAISIIAFVLPGGLVAREAGIALALSPVMPAAPALALAVLVRIAQLALEVALAVITPLIARRPTRPG